MSNTLPHKYTVVNLFEILDSLDFSLLLTELLVGIIFFYKLRTELQMLFYNTVVSLFHLLIFSHLHNAVSVNAEWYLVTLSGAGFYMLFLLYLKKVKNIKRTFLFFLGIISLMIICEIGFIGIDSYRISPSETIVDFILLIVSFDLFIYILKKNQNFQNKFILMLLFSQIQFLVYTILYNITLFFTYHPYIEQHRSIYIQLLMLSSVLNSIFTSIAFIWSPRKENFLKL